MTQTNWTAKVTLTHLSPHQELNQNSVTSQFKDFHFFQVWPHCGLVMNIWTTTNLKPLLLLTLLCDLQVVLIHPGLTSLIAHIRVGRMQVALEAKSTVLPAVGRLRWLMSLLG